jgi:hypothetical protein
VKNMGNDWQLYRTRFLVKARQLTRRMTFVDALGREHCGNKGDYLVESCDGARRIAPRTIFEDVYVIMGASPGQDALMTEMPTGTIGLPVGGMRKHIVENRRLNQASRALIA